VNGSAKARMGEKAKPVNKNCLRFIGFNFF
jgi:hypothetical protein